VKHGRILDQQSAYEKKDFVQMNINNEVDCPPLPIYQPQSKD